MGPGARGGGARGGGAAAARAPSPAHPLAAASLDLVACDLADPRWTDALSRAGFDPALRTVWVAEGLLMYLTEATVAALLGACRRLSGAGSVFLINAATRLPAPSPEAAFRGWFTATYSGGSLAGGREGPRGGGRGGGKRRGAGGGLMDEWVWLSDPDPGAFLAGLGWRTLSRVWRGHPEMSYGRVPAAEQTPEFPAPRDGARFGTSLFIRAVAA